MLFFDSEFMYPFSRRHNLWSAAVPSADALCMAGHWLGVCRFLLPAGAAGGPGADLVSDAERGAGG